MEDILWTLNEVATRLKLSRQTIQRHIYNGKIYAVKIAGGQWRIRELEVQRLLKQETNQNK